VLINGSYVGQIIQDIVIGLSDGLTVPFALTAGLSNLGTSHVVVTAGLAEIVAGAISMVLYMMLLCEWTGLLLPSIGKKKKKGTGRMAVGPLRDGALLQRAQKGGLGGRQLPAA